MATKRNFSKKISQCFELELEFIASSDLHLQNFGKGVYLCLNPEPNKAKVLELGSGLLISNIFCAILP
jgi:hypothetical protein